jgi:hypothetical protein
MSTYIYQTCLLNTFMRLEKLDLKKKWHFKVLLFSSGFIYFTWMLRSLIKWKWDKNTFNEMRIENRKEINHKNFFLVEIDKIILNSNYIDSKKGHLKRRIFFYLIGKRLFFSILFFLKDTKMFWKSILNCHYSNVKLSLYNTYTRS